MTSAPRFAVVLLMAAALGLVALVPASARTDVRSKYGGTLVVGIGGDPDTLDPTFMRGQAAFEVAKSFCEQLYDYDRKARIVPQLAAALPVISKDKLTYTIALRQGIRFNDGTPFNAQAVVTTIQRMITPGSFQASDFASVESVTASGSYRVVIHLKARFTPLTATLATAAGVVLSPTQLAKLGDNFGTDPVCVGPFMFDHRVAGDHVTVIKAPYYYDQKNVYLDKIVYKPMTNAAAAAAALKAGDIQVLDPVSPTELPGVQQTSSLRVLRAPGLGWRGLVINLGNKNGIGTPYSNVGTPLASSPALRQAFEEAIDRKAMNRVVFSGTTQTGCTPVSPASPTFDASIIQCTPYNPKHAQKLVAASGFSNPTVRLLMPDGTDNLRLAQFIQGQEKAVGINVVIDLFPFATFQSFLVSGNFDTVLVGPASGANADTNFYQWFASSGSTNYGRYSNPRLDLILANARKATTAKALKTLYHTAEQILANDRPAIFLYHSVRYAAVDSGVTGVQLRSADLLLGVAFAQYR